jgi:phosphatidylserine/phosphatidylglycerophosphate/cardiolipin synthase-like enzyme
MRRLPQAPDTETRQVPVRWLEDRAHYDFALRALTRAQHSLWIATANLKDMRLEAPIGTVARAKKRFVSVTDYFSGLVSRGVELRILLAAQPSGPFKESLGKQSSLADTPRWLRQCPRVHLKLIVIDGTELYLGSANLTGAGMGAKGEGRRNFELGVVTSDHVLVDAAQRRFDRIWSGRECKGCRVRDKCPAPLDASEVKTTLEPRPAPRKRVGAGPPASGRGATPRGPARARSR